MLRSKSKPSKKPRQPLATTNGNLEPCDVLTLAEAAAYLRASPEDVIRLIDTEGLPARKVGTDWRLYKAAIQSWLSTPRERGLLGELGKIKDDPYMEEMLRDIYARRGRPEVEET